MGADRCRRQRKAERLRALVDRLVEKCEARVTKEFTDLASGSPSDAKVGDYTLEEAKQRIAEFKQNANRQLALMTLQRSKRAVEVKRLKWRAGVYEVPGEGLPIWSFDDVRDYAVEQVRLIEDWTGERIASEDVDDSRIDQRVRPASEAEAGLGVAGQAVRVQQGGRDPSENDGAG